MTKPYVNVMHALIGCFSSIFLLSDHNCLSYRLELDCSTGVKATKLKKPSFWALLQAVVTPMGACSRPLTRPHASAWARARVCM